MSFISNVLFSMFLSVLTVSSLVVSSTVYLVFTYFLFRGLNNVSLCVECGFVDSVDIPYPLIVVSYHLLLLVLCYVIVSLCQGLLYLLHLSTFYFPGLTNWPGPEIKQLYVQRVVVSGFLNVSHEIGVIQCDIPTSPGASRATLAGHPRISHAYLVNLHLPKEHPVLRFF